MKLSIPLSLISLSQVAFSTNIDKRGVQVVKVTKTVDNTVTNTQIVDAPTSTVINWSTSTSTTTTTRYTSTLTSTIFGNVYTYLSVYSSVVAIIDTSSRTGTDIETTAPSAITDKTDTPIVSTPITTSSPAAIVTNKELTSSTPVPGTTTSVIPLASTIVTSSPSSVNLISPSTQNSFLPSSTILDGVTTTGTAPTGASTTGSINSGTTTTSTVEETGAFTTDSQITSFPSIWDGYTLGDYSTSVESGSICVVDYDYYSQDYTETLTTTTVVYQTVTI